VTEPKTLLEVMTKALKDGREKRAAERQAFDGDLKEAIESRDREGIGAILDRASNRNMLVRDKVENRYGEEIPVELSEVKQTEPYQKRPVVRAIKRVGRSGLGR
jgi:hypothetical protein